LFVEKLCILQFGCLFISFLFFSLFLIYVFFLFQWCRHTCVKHVWGFCVSSCCSECCAQVLSSLAFLDTTNPSSLHLNHFFDRGLHFCSVCSPSFSLISFSSSFSICRAIDVQVWVMLWRWCWFAQNLLRVPLCAQGESVKKVSCLFQNIPSSRSQSSFSIHSLIPRLFPRNNSPGDSRTH
jgi:hypothetical protein